MPKFSVVIPLYNKEKYIQRAIDSVLSQTIEDFELIIVNDGSTDCSFEKASGYSDSRIHIIDQKNVGLAGARNRGMDEARADFIALLDADDEWEPDFLETIARLIKKYPHAGAYGTARLTIFAGGKVKHYTVVDIPDTGWEGLIEDFFKAHALGASPLHPCTVCIPKKIYKELGGFPYGVKLYEDIYCWINIALHYPIAYSTKIGAKYYRDMVGIPVTVTTNVLFYAGTMAGAAVLGPLLIVGAIDKRARMTDPMRFRDQAALDPYIFVREGYTQQREYLIYDGMPPLDIYSDFEQEEEFQLNVVDENNCKDFNACQKDFIKQ